MKKLLFAFSFLFFINQLMAQTGNVGIGTTSPDPTAALDISSADKGILIPRTTKSAVESAAVGSIPEGLLIYDTDDNSFYYRDANEWKKLGIQSELIDADGDTKIELDEGIGIPDGINFTLDNTEHIVMRKNADGTFRIDLPNNNGNTAIGENVLTQNETGSDNIAIGKEAMRQSTSPNENIAIGRSALYKNNGTDNISIGRNNNQANNNGNENVSIGSAALFNNEEGSGNVALGYAAGALEMGSNKLYIESSSTAQDSTTSLIYGEFDKDSLRFNAAVNINGNYILPTTSGAAGQVITANADGTTEWAENIGTFETVNGVVRNTGDDATEDFVFGSNELPQNGVNTTDTLFFFDKDKGAFRVGRLANSDSWSSNKIGISSFASGYNTTAPSFSSTAMGYFTTALGEFATAMGESTSASGENSTAMGESTMASGENSTAMGESTTASGDYSTAMGISTSATAFGETAIGMYNTDDPNATSYDFNGSDRLFTVGNGTFSSKSDAMIIYKNGNVRLYDSLYIGADGSEYSLPIEKGIVGQVITANADGSASWAETASAFETDNGVVRNTGDHATEDFVFGSDSLPQNGVNTTDKLFFFDKDKAAFRVGDLTDSDNWETDNIGEYSFASGRNTKASGFNSTAMGFSTTASGQYSTAMGYETTAAGLFTTAMGYQTTASADYSTAIGFNTTASYDLATAMGYYTTAYGNSSTSMGRHTTARAYVETAIGMYNTIDLNDTRHLFIDSDRLFTVGNGKSDTERSDAMIIYKNGNVRLYDSLYIGADGSEYSLPIEKGTVGQVITANADGSASWAETASTFETDNGVVRNKGNHATEDFVFGSDQLPQNGMIISDTLFFFDKEKGAFRSGTSFLSDNWSQNNLGRYSFSSGWNTRAKGDYSSAFGYGSYANGEHSTSLGLITQADAFNEVAIGSYNTIDNGASPDTWVGTDRLFTVGNGEDAQSRSDAMIVHKNGNTEINGDLGIGTNAAFPVHINGGVSSSYIKQARSDNEGVSYRASGISWDLRFNNASNIFNNNHGIFLNHFSFEPYNGDTLTLGSAGYKWKEVYALNATINTSDIRFKKNINNLEYGLETVMQMRPVSYQWKKEANGRTINGFIAQEMEEIVPEVVEISEVTPNPNKPCTESEYSELYGMRYTELIPVLTKAIQDQQAIIEALTERVEALEKK